MEIVSSLAIGYFLGSANPALFFSRRKNVNLREEGTKNPGASNTLLVMGKKYGAIVMILDIAKAFLSSKIARWLFPKLYLAQLLAGLGAVIGHVFPMFHGFKGGKGLAAFGGMVLAFKPWIFFSLLTLGCILLLIVNASYAMPMSAAVLFPILAVLQTQRLDVFLVCAAASAIVIVKHWSNIGKGMRGEDVNIRKFIKDTFSKTA